MRRQARLFYLKTTWNPILQYGYDYFSPFSLSFWCAVLLPYSPTIRNNAVMHDEIIENYFNHGLTAPELNRIFFLKCTRHRDLVKTIEKNTQTVMVYKTSASNPCCF